MSALPQASSATPLEVLAAQHEHKPGALLSVLETLQGQHEQNFLPTATLRDVARVTGLPLSQIYSVATFYAFFNLSPQGRHTVTICRGTACHTRGSLGLLDSLEASLGLKSADAMQEHPVSRTTADGNITVRTVACFGQCALAPVVELDRVIHGHMNQQKLVRSVQRLTIEGAPV